MAHLLHIYRRYFPDEGGIETAMRSFCEFLAQQGQDVSVLASSSKLKTIRENINNVDIIRCARLGSLAHTPLCPTMPRWITRLKPHLIELHHAYPFGMWAVKQARYRGPLIVNYHFDISRFRLLQPLFQPLLADTLRRADYIFVNSRSYAETSLVLRDYLDKCIFVPYGCNPQDFALTEAIEPRVAALRQSGHFRVLFVGRLTHYKGLETLIAAMTQAPGHLYIVGRGPLAESLRALAYRLGVEERVHLLGYAPHDELIAQYYAADVVVLPSVSRGESFGLVQLEAMMCGKPVICSDLPGVRDVGLPGVTKLVFPPGDVEALAAALKHLAENEALRHQLGACGRAYALKHYHIDHIHQQRWQIYQKLLS